MEDPQPDRIHNYPDGNITYLFRKALSATDISRGLDLVGNAATRTCLDAAYQRGLNGDLLGGFNIRLCSPECHVQGTLKRTHDQAGYYLYKLGWQAVVDRNGFYEGLEIDCWAVTHGQDQLSLLVQPVKMGDPEPNKIQNYPDGNITYLFRKTLSAADVSRGINLVESAATRSFLGDRAGEIGEFKIMLYSPECHVEVTLKRTLENAYGLLKTRWQEVVERNGFYEGEEIDCWVITHDGQDELSLLVQSVDAETSDDEESEIETETETETGDEKTEADDEETETDVEETEDEDEEESEGEDDSD